MPWQPGQSGNLAGRPPGTGKSEAFRELLQAKMPLERLFEAMDTLVFRLYDPKATMYMIDRHLGRPAQAITVSGDPERPLHALVGVVARDLTALAPQEAPEQLPAPEAHCLDDLEGAGAYPSRSMMEPKTPRGAREMELRYPPEMR